MCWGPGLDKKDRQQAEHQQAPLFTSGPWMPWKQRPRVPIALASPRDGWKLLLSGTPQDNICLWSLLFFPGREDLGARGERLSWKGMLWCVLLCPEPGPHALAQGPLTCV